METPTYYVKLFINNDRKTYDKYTAEAERLRVGGYDAEQVARRLARMMENEYKEPSFIESLPVIYQDVLRSALMNVDYLSVARDFLDE